ncbi:hypothetical protein SASPL_101919 [Salvia splendens]|uniref:Uncharacterized protein n=1 Tax=Salvia splendens TaxID=180675 RepID=A0A8X9ABN2_SALSN|nr:hypothetical protein SASPL_101919 [Salvia splendens]
MSDYMRSSFTSTDVPSSQAMLTKEYVAQGFHISFLDLAVLYSFEWLILLWFSEFPPQTVKERQCRSGVGFNLHDDYKIDCDDDQWSQIVKVIFGKDRAAGGLATGLMDAVNGLYSQDTGLGSSDGGGIGHSVGSTHVPTADPLNARPAGGKKRKADLSIDDLIELLGKMNDATNARLEILSLRTGYEFDLSKARKEVFVELGRLPGLTREQKFDAWEIILEKVERLDFFLGLSDDDRITFVFRVLAKYGSG